MMTDQIIDQIALVAVAAAGVLVVALGVVVLALIRKEDNDERIER